MIKLTQNGEMKWYTDDTIKRPEIKKDQKIETIFVCNHKNKKLRIYKKTYKPNDFFSKAISTGFGHDEERMVSKLILEFIDIDGNKLWQFPDINALVDLFESVQYQAAGVDDFINDILEDGAE